MSQQRKPWTSPLWAEDSQLGNKVVVDEPSGSEAEVTEFQAAFNLFDLDGGGDIDAKELGTVGQHLTRLTVHQGGSSFPPTIPVNSYTCACMCMWSTNRNLSAGRPPMAAGAARRLERPHRGSDERGGGGDDGRDNGEGW